MGPGTARLAFFADAAVLLGAAVFGAAIILVAQIYHIESHFPVGVLLWGAGTLLAAWLGAPRGAVILALGCFALWSWLEIFGADRLVHWPYIAAWLACLAVVETLRAPPARHVLVFTGLGWIAATFVSLLAERHLGAPMIFSLTAATAAALWALSHLLAAKAHETLMAYGLHAAERRRRLVVAREPRPARPARASSISCPPRWRWR